MVMALATWRVMVGLSLMALWYSVEQSPSVNPIIQNTGGLRAIRLAVSLGKGYVCDSVHTHTHTCTVQMSFVALCCLIIQIQADQTGIP